MRIVYEKPKWWKWVEYFSGAKWGRSIMTWGETIYTFRELRPDELAHEMVHVKQQGKHPFLFFIRCQFSKSFYLRAELEAYRAQLKELGAFAAPLLAEKISSILYGNLITYDEALEELT
jgi:hypothetical protein